MSTATTNRGSTRERLLRAAHELFYRDGYGVSIDAIADHADVAKPTVYVHFGSKEGLIEAVLRQASEQWFTDLDEELDRRSGQPLAQLMAPFDLLVADLPDPSYRGCVLVNAAATFCSSGHPAQQVLAAHDQRLRAVFERLAAAAGSARPTDLSRQLLLLFDGIKVKGIVDPSGAAAGDARAAAEALLNRQP